MAKRPKRIEPVATPEEWDQPIVKRLRQVLFAPGNDGIAVLLSGPWGAGKTWLWENVLRVDESRGSRAVVYASLFGAADLEQIAKRVLAASVMQADHGTEISERLKAILKRIAGASKKFVESQAGIDLAISMFEPLDVIPEGAVVCLDDIERTDSKLGLEVVIGAINYLTLHRHCRVLVLANPDGIDEGQRPEWPALREKTFLAEYRLHTSPKVERAVIEACSPRLDESERSVIFEVHHRSQNTNLRQLQRVARMVEDISVRLGQPLPEAAVASAYFLMMEKETQLKSPEYYSGLGSVLRFIPAPPDPDARKRAKEERELIWRYFGTDQAYVFWPPFYEYVRDGFVGPTLEAYFRPSAVLKGEAERLLSDLSRGERLIYRTDDAIKRWCEAVVAAIKEPTPVSSRVLLALTAYLANCDDSLGTSYLESIATTLEQRMLECAASDPIAGFEFLIPEDSIAKTATSKFASILRKERDRLELEALRLAYVDAVERVDLRKVDELLGARQIAEVIFEEPMLDALLGKFDVSRRLVGMVLQTIARRMPPLGTAEQRAFLAEKLRLLPTDKMGRQLLGQFREDLLADSEGHSSPRAS